MTNKAKGFTVAGSDQSEAFDLEKKQGPDAQAQIHKLAQNTEKQVELKVEGQPAAAAEQEIRLDIDAVDLIKVRTSVSKAKKAKGGSRKVKELKAYKQLHRFFNIGHSIPIREKQTFYDLLAVMIEAGIPIVQAIRVYADQTGHKYFRTVCLAIMYQLERGQKFSDTLADYPKVFIESERGIIAAAEATGRLVESMRRLAGEVEKSAALRSKVRGALIYPSIVLVFVVITIFVLLRFVVPQISQLFIDTGLALPTVTVVVIAASEFIVDNGYLLLGLLIAIGIANYAMYQYKPTRYYYHYFMLKMPAFGQFQKDIAQAGFAQSLANLIASGVGIVQTLDITAKSINNLVYQKKIKLLAKDVANGISIGDSLENSPYFSNMLVSMITVGEKTAQIDSIATRLANYYTDKVYNTADNFSKLLQPLIIGVVGVIVGVVVLAIMLPMSEILGSVGAF